MGDSSRKRHLLVGWPLGGPRATQGSKWVIPFCFNESVKNMGGGYPLDRTKPFYRGFEQMDADQKQNPAQAGVPPPHPAQDRRAMGTPGCATRASSPRTQPRAAVLHGHGDALLLPVPGGARDAPDVLILLEGADADLAFLGRAFLADPGYAEGGAAVAALHADDGAEAQTGGDSGQPGSEIGDFHSVQIGVKEFPLGIHTPDAHQKSFG